LKLQQAQTHETYVETRKGKNHGEEEREEFHYNNDDYIWASIVC